MTIKNKDKENCSTNPGFDVIIGHFADECKKRKKPRVHEESMNLTTKESNLFMAYIEDILLQGVQEMNLQDSSVS